MMATPALTDVISCMPLHVPTAMFFVEFLTANKADYLASLRFNVNQDIPLSTSWSQA